MTVKSTSLQTYKTRKKADEVIASGSSPLDVMLGNMRFWHAEAQSLTKKLENFAQYVHRAVENGEEIDQDLVKDMMKKLDRMNMARDRAQTCAKDAAPYVHPRLASLVPKPEGVGDGPSLPPLTLEVVFDEVDKTSVTDLPGSEKATTNPDDPSGLEEFAEQVIENSNKTNDILDGAA